MREGGGRLVPPTLPPPTLPPARTRQVNSVRHQNLFHAPLRSDVTVFDFVHRLRVSAQSPSRIPSPIIDTVKASVVAEGGTLQREGRFRREPNVPRICVHTVIHHE